MKWLKYDTRDFEFLRIRNELSILSFELGVPVLIFLKTKSAFEMASTNEVKQGAQSLRNFEQNADS